MFRPVLVIVGGENLYILESTEAFTYQNCKCFCKIMFIAH